MINFIINPDSGGERGYAVWRRIERRLIRKKTEYRAFITNGPGDAASIADRLSSADDGEEVLVVAVGGDGTVNEVLNGLHISDRITLGFIPTGSGNDLARGLHLPVTPEGCLKRILRPKEIRKIDYGILTYGENGENHRRFLNSAGAGYDAAVNQDILDADIKRKFARFGLQKAAYFVAGFLRFLKFRTVQGYVILDGVKRAEFNHLFFLSAHIHPMEGGGYRFAPKAKDTDGELSVCIVHNRSKRQIMKILSSARFGNHLKFAGVRSYSCTEIEVHTEEPLQIHADGELFGSQTDFGYRCVRQKLNVIC